MVVVTADLSALIQRSAALFYLYRVRYSGDLWTVQLEL